MGRSRISSVAFVGFAAVQIACAKGAKTEEQTTLTSAPVVARAAATNGAGALPKADPRAWQPRVDLAGSFNSSDAPAATGSRIASIAMETRIFATPDRRSAVVGMLRAGAILPASPENVAGPGCTAGYAKVTSNVRTSAASTIEGFVCLDTDATRDLSHPIALASTIPADLSAKLPYIYGTVKRGGPVYARLPDAEMLASNEPHLAAHLAKWKRDRDWGASYGLELWTRRKKGDPPSPIAAYTDRVTDPDIPAFLADGRVAPNLSGAIRSSAATKIGEVSLHNGIAFLDTYLYQGRRYGVTTDLRVLPTDRFRAIRGSEYHGVRIPEEAQIPFAIIRAKNQRRWKYDHGRWVQGARLEQREIVPLTASSRFHDGHYYYEAKDGDFLDDRGATKVEPIHHVPGWAQKGEKWLDINVSKQLLIAYESDKPVYATLVSTGEAGLGDPETTRSTRQGIFRIHTKLVTATMDSKVLGEEFELRDVPYVQYFQDGYALHAAYWHDVFGMPKSHGCINLAPEDARRLFHWTEPQLPDDWHGVRKALTGTVVFIHR